MSQVLRPPPQGVVDDVARRDVLDPGQQGRREGGEGPVLGLQDADVEGRQVEMRGCHVEVEILLSTPRLARRGGRGRRDGKLGLSQALYLLLGRVDGADGSLRPLAVLLEEQFVLLLLAQQILDLSVVLLLHVASRPLHDPGVVQHVGGEVPRHVVDRVEHLGASLPRQRQGALGVPHHEPQHHVVARSRQGALLAGVEPHRPHLRDVDGIVADGAVPPLGLLARPRPVGAVAGSVVAAHAGVHEADQAGEAKDVPASRHPRSDRFRQADGTRGLLGLGAGQDLQHVGPVEVLVGVDSVLRVVAGRRDHEAVVCVDVAGLVGGVVAGADAPGGVPAVGARVQAVGEAGVVAVVVVAGGKGVVQQVGDGGLAAAAGRVPHRAHLGHGVFFVGVRAPGERSTLVAVLLSRPLALPRSRMRGGRAHLAGAASRLEARRRAARLVLRRRVRSCGWNR
ncbi:hypothetical protein VTK73DRAFT_3504 [Phialemonium thermophilum]|uniref:Uncharacterized protein n=1 Tax=Phialemonium thermophilum TaxID=223376 RepID=A0ABR3VIY9_9PEZI